MRPLPSGFAARGRLRKRKKSVRRTLKAGFASRKRWFASRLAEGDTSANAWPGCSRKPFSLGKALNGWFREGQAVLTSLSSRACKTQSLLAAELPRQGLLGPSPRQTLSQHGWRILQIHRSNRFGSEKSPAIAFNIPQKSTEIGAEIEGDFHDIFCCLASIHAGLRGVAGRQIACHISRRAPLYIYI